MAAVAGARWKRWVFLYLQLGAFVVITLFPFYYMAVTSLRPDREMYIPWNRPNFAPFWTLQPTLEHFTLLFRETLFLRWLANTLIISVLSTGIALVCGLLAVKQLKGVSDEDAVAEFMESPYIQAFCGLEYFELEQAPNPVGSRTHLPWGQESGPGVLESEDGL